jgi:hypothetical protein
MIGKMMKVLAYRRAPRTMAALAHPGASAALAHTKYDMRYGYAPRISAVGTALLAVPVGFLIGRLITRRGAAKQASQVRIDQIVTPPM